MPLPFMVWSAGQREFSPLLLGVYNLLPEDSDRPRAIEWVVLEEPEMGLHPRAISAVLFLVLELLGRGYRVCISTHSPHILDLVWALRVLIEHEAPAEVVLKLFDVSPDAASTKLAAAVLQKKLKVYSFNREGLPVTDISRLDPESSSLEETTWGGLTEFSARTADVSCSGSKIGCATRHPPWIACPRNLSGSCPTARATQMTDASASSSPRSTVFAATMAC